MFDRISRRTEKPGFDISIDVETTGLHTHKDTIFGVSLTVRKDGELCSQYEDIRRFDKKHVVCFLSALLARARYIVNHNMKFDALMLMAFGVDVPLEKCICSMVRASLIDEHTVHYSLDALSKQFLNQSKVDDIYQRLAAEFGGEATRKVQILNLNLAKPELVGPYAIRDTELAYQLYEWQSVEIGKQDLGEIDRLERDAFVPLTLMEYRGIRVDIGRAQRAMKDMGSLVGNQLKELQSLMGDVNPNSPKQLAKFFAPHKKKGDDAWYVRKNGDTREYRIGSTAGGEASWGKETLKSLPYREAVLLMEIKSNIKTRDTFLGGHVLGHAYKDRVYPTINQTKGSDGGTGTGRLSYTEPALQQIPSRNKEVAKIVRSVFLPDENHGWSYGDLDQHEYRVFAHYANSPSLINAYKKDPDLDVHQFVADLTGIPRNIPKEGGANAKQLNLSIVFCMSDGRVAQVLGLPFTTEKNDRGYTMLVPGEETKAILAKYHAKFPGVKELQNKVKSKAKMFGWVRSIKGRHIRFPDGDGVYKSPGLLFQTSSGDLNKDNLIRAHKVLSQSKHGSRLLLNIHDEYSVSIAPEDVALMKEIQQEIQNRPELRVPIRIDFGKPAHNWWFATQKETE
jgi:DNA polymerase I